MEIEEAKDLVKGLTGVDLPARREVLAKAALGSLTASLSVAQDSEVVYGPSATIKRLIGLTANALVSGLPDKEVEARALDIVKAAGYVVESAPIKLGVGAYEVFKKYGYSN